MIDDREWTDGGVSLTLPIRKVIEEFKPTDLLVLANCSPERQRKRFSLEQMLLPILFAKFPREVREAFERRNDEFADDLRFLREQTTTNCLVLWTGSDIGRFERDSNRLAATAERADRELSELLRTASKASKALTL